MDIVENEHEWRMTFAHERAEGGQEHIGELTTVVETAWERFATNPS